MGIKSQKFVIAAALLLLVGVLLPVAGQNYALPGPTQSGVPFPRVYPLSGGGTLTLYEPQIESWVDQKSIEAWFALSYESAPGAKAAIGSMKITAATEVSMDLRLVKFEKFAISEINLPTLSKDDASRVTTALQVEVPDDGRVLELDKVLAAVGRSSLATEPAKNKNVRSEPPTIVYSDTPAILVSFDGEPLWNPTFGTDLKYAVNTNWDIFQHAANAKYYLRNGEFWYRSDDVKTGWEPAGDLPDSFSRLAANDNWADTRANIPGKRVYAGKMPRVVVVTSPTELIVTDGKPKTTPVGTTSLRWLSNTESDVFQNGSMGTYYYLVAGRWFSAPSLMGPWTFATPDLPEDFKKIPLEHARSRVLASVPGTPQANEAVLQATAARTAQVSLSQLEAPIVAYQGEPRFEPVEGTKLLRGANTDKQVLQVGYTFYLCYQGVWFEALEAKGPWKVSTEIPAEIYTIPATSSVHNVTYVTVKDDDPSDDWVTYSYLPAYSGVMVDYGCAVWGTGYYYPPYIYSDYIYPIYYPYYGTYGYSAYYNPFFGTFGRGGRYYGPYGGAMYGSRYNPNTGRYMRGEAVYGPYNAQSFARAYNPRTGTFTQTQRGSNVYGSWGSTFVKRGDDWAMTGSVTNRFNGNTTRGIRTDRGTAVTRDGALGRTTAFRPDGGNVYAGHDGGIYMNAGDGWQKYENGAWSYVGDGSAAKNAAVRRSEAAAAARIDGPTLNQLNRDASIRNEARQRANDLRDYQPTMAGRAAGSFRGGGFGGGGRR